MPWRIPLWILAALLLTAPPAGARSLVDRGGVTAAKRWAAGREGRVAFAVVDERGRVRGYRAAEHFQSASLSKAMLLVAALRAARGRDLRRGEPWHLRSMVTLSDNDAAWWVYRRVGGQPAMLEVARAARMRQFVEVGWWSDEEVTAADQARFFARIDRLVPREHRDYARELLSSVIAYQRWGIPTAVHRDGTRVFFKGGWRKDVVHQGALSSAAAIASRSPCSPRTRRRSRTRVRRSPGSPSACCASRSRRTGARASSRRGPGSLVADFAAVAREFERLVGGAGGGGALVVRRGDEVVLDVCTGTADRLGRVPWTRDTLGLSFSTTKGVASTVIHRLADRGLLDYDEPVATYWPAFAAGGKGRITVRHVLTHRAGLQSIGAVARRADDLLDHLGMEARLAAAPSRRPDGALGLPRDHVRLAAFRPRAPHHRPRHDRAVPRESRRAARAATGCTSASRRGDGVTVAEPVGSALRHVTIAAQLLAPVWRRTALTRTAVDALHVPGFHRLFEGLEAPIWAAQMPAVSGAFTADALARMYGALAARGGPLLSPATTDAAGRVQVRTADAVLGLRMRWRLGYHQAFGGGPAAPRAFGHYGYGGSGGWADPDSGLSLGFVTNRIGSVSTPLGDLNLFRLTGLVRQAAAQSAPASRAAGRAA